MACVTANHHQTKINHVSPLAHTERRQPKQAQLNPITGIVITPDTVPRFVIPPKRIPRLQLDDEDIGDETSKRTIPDDDSSEPGSMLAQTMSHLSTKVTPYGFRFLSESPITTRKESLYRKKRVADKQLDKTIISEHIVTNDKSPQSNRMNVHSTKSMESCESSEWSSSSYSSSPSSSPRPSLHKIVRRKNCLIQSSQSHGNIYSSTLSPNMLTIRRPISSPSTPSETRAATAPETRRKFVPQNKSSPGTGNNSHCKLKTRSRSLRAELPEKLHLYCMRRRSFVRDLGDVVLELRYFRDSEILEVEVIRGENLGGSSYTGDMNPFLKLSITPGKQQQHRTMNMKGTRDPQFNEKFLFKDFKPLQLLHLSLRVKVCSKRSNLRRAEHIGDITVPLRIVIDGEQHTIVANVQNFTSETPRITLHVSLCMKLKSSCLLVTVIKAENLPKSAIASSPDPYVHVELTKSNGEELKTQEYQTPVRRGTCNPVFKEAFSFPISNKTNAEDVSLLFIVRDHDYIRRDAYIGHVRLGVGRTTTEHCKSWNEIFIKPGRSVTLQCTLCTMPIDY